MYLFYSDEIACQNDCDTMKTNKMKQISSENNGNVIVDVETMQEAKLSSLSPEQINELVIFGVKNGNVNKTGGFTVNINKPKKAYGKSIWYIEEFSDLMDGVTNFDGKIKKIPAEWFEPLGE